MGSIALIRFATYGIGYLKYQTYSALHTYMNKITGMLLFALPGLFLILNIYVVTVLVCVIAFISASEELFITLKSKELNRDCKSILKC